jgi:hypothetical protein
MICGQKLAPYETGPLPRAMPCPILMQSPLAAILPLGYTYRFTEAYSFYTGGATIRVSGGNNCYAAALFALDFMHWRVLHECGGVNLHTKMHPTNW